MKLARFRVDGTVAYGEIIGDTVVELSGSYFGPYTRTSRKHPLSQVQLLAPSEPSKIICVGLNYADHARESNMQLPEEPCLFMKGSTAMLDPEGEIVYPAICQRLDYEAELAFVIKDRIRHVPVAEARRHILGYTCLNDVTARDLQKKDGQWTRSKGFDTFAPFGPWIEADVDPGHLPIRLSLNGTVKQQSNTDQLVFGVDQLVSFITAAMTLLPGDVVSTGTPSGIGPMQRGDVVEVTIDGIGTLRNRVV